MLTTQEKHERRVARMLAKAQEYRVHIYLAKFVAPVFQRMVRAEAGARFGFEKFVHQGTIQREFVKRGKCICVTCGKIRNWEGDKKAGIEGMDTGHFVSSRKASIVLEESNVAPQCVACNKYRHGMPEAYERWMDATHGQDEIERLRALKLTTRRFTHEELVDLRIGYMARLDKAVREIERA